MNTQAGASAALNAGLRIFFTEFVRVSLSRPVQALFFGRTLLWQRAAAARRVRAVKKGVPVPPIAIFSITQKCNLRCKGCYAQAIRADAPDLISTDRLRSIVAEAEKLGISFFVIAGGEPLTRPEIVEIAREHPRVIFLLATNGLLLDDALIRRLATQPNTIPALSIEGTRTDTDARRGAGVHGRLEAKMAALKAAGVFFSLSITVTRSNFDTVTDPAFLQRAVGAGCRFFLLLEYTPIQDGTDGWVITESQRERMKGLLESFRRRFRAVFVGVPWDEEEQGGCLAAGRGFIHISAAGDLEPCPLAPFSDTNILTLPLREALRSRFLAALRENHELFAETADGCALWKNRAAIRGMLEDAAV